MRPAQCKQNKRYHTSARVTLAYKKTTSVHGTDGQTDRVRRNMRPPPTEEGRIIIVKKYITFKNTQYDKINRFNKCPCITFDI